jgi:uncharacterized membrane protein YjgN (DUF898 family)
MDMRTDAAPQAPALRHTMRFEGSGGEYFKIWIVNLALTVATLGIFSAWAKVRSKRYFYGNTYIGEHNFDYHGLPLRILLGRAIAVGILLLYGLARAFVPWLTLVFALAFFFGAPWLVNAALRFNARNSGYRNIRFNFVATYGGAFSAYVGWAVLAAITLFTTYPLARRARDQFNINNHMFGGKYFHADIPGGAMYRIYIMGLVMFLGFVIVVGSIIATVFHGAIGKGTTPGAFSIWYLIILGVFAFVPLFLMPFIGTQVFNLAVGRTVLAERYQLESTLSPLRMTWLAFSNLALTLVTLGLFYPWARTRVARYRAENISITGPADMDGFQSEFGAGPGAIGEEVASLFDIDIGL